jgi:alpha-glucuronidase
MVFAEDGSQLWLRFPAKNGISADKIISKGNSPTLKLPEKS